MPNASLLIFIPTFNRVTTAVQQVRALMSQIKNNELVQLVVSDNHSLDETFSELTQLTAGQPNVRIERRSGNVGGNGNALLGFSFPAESDYLWILSDDTIVAPGAVEIILKSAALKPDFISIKMESTHPTREGFDISSEGISGVFSSSSWGQFSSVVYSRTFISKSLESGFAFHESSFPHLAVLFDACWRRGYASITEVSGKDIFDNGEKDNMTSGVYTLSLTGRPTLLAFAASHERRKLAIAWSRENSIGLAAFKAQHQMGSLASKALLIRHGGLAARTNLAIGELIFGVQSTKVGGRLVSVVQSNPKLKKLFLSTRITFFGNRS
jgi:glycosyltransferase involved in cell wall biosynthesis